MTSLKSLVKKTVIGKFIQAANRLFSNKKFPGSGTYWEEHYKAGGNSGPGSYNRLAEFKAKVINKFLEDNNVADAMEFGSGDGNNLSLVKYKKYTGLDISASAIKHCQSKFQTDSSKGFYLYNSLAFIDTHKLFKATLTLSLDVIYHLVEDDVYEKYMTDLFNASDKYVIIYSRDYAEAHDFHVRSRSFSKWVADNQKSFKLIEKIDNPYKFDIIDPDNTSNAVFHFYQRS